MKKLLLSATLLISAAVGFAAPSSDNLLPHLETRHGVRQLIVDGKPFLMLAGELGNSTSSSEQYMKGVWPTLVEKQLNTVLAAVSWELIEPQEGKFDFKLVDSFIEGARANQMRVVFLWFGSWKNGLSSYPPFWVKTNYQKYPLVKDYAGKSLDILSTFGEETVKADARAFAALMRHIREVDGKQHTVILMQVQNEVGVRGDSRDRSPAANEAYAKPVPKELMSYLVEHKDTLAPELLEVWQANGFKTAGTWEAVFGPGLNGPYPPALPSPEANTVWRKLTWASDEFFMAWHYARFCNKVTAAGKAEYDLPMYCNAWLQQPSMPRPGEYPCGGPVPQVNDIWRAGAPSVDFLSPDIYLPQFDETCARYVRNGNPLFVPEASANSAPENVLTALLKYNGMGYSPFGIERESGGGGRGGRGGQRGGGTNAAPTEAAATNAVTNAVPEGGRGTGMLGLGAGTTNTALPRANAQALTYAILDYVAPAILAAQGKNAVVVLKEDPENPQVVPLGDFTLTITYGTAAATAQGSGRGARGGGGFGGRGGGDSLAPWVGTNAPLARFVINPSPGEYWFVGGPMNVSFKPNKTTGPQTVRLGSFDETIYTDGRWVPGRRINGDENDHDRRFQTYLGTFGIYRYTVYCRD